MAHPSLKQVSAEAGSLVCAQGKAIKPSERAPLNTSVTALFVFTTSKKLVILNTIKPLLDVKRAPYFAKLSFKRKMEQTTK